jgi:hypothetical protein
MPAHTPATAAIPTAAKANAAAAMRRHVAIAAGIPTTVMHIHFKTMAKVCQEWMKPFQAAVGIVKSLVVFAVRQFPLMVMRL